MDASKDGLRFFWFAEWKDKIMSHYVQKKTNWVLDVDTCGVWEADLLQAAGWFGYLAC